MPELTSEHLPELLEQNKSIHREVEELIKTYYLKFHQRGWTVVDGIRKWMEDEHYLLQAPIQDDSFGGFLYFQAPRHICYVNTWQPRVYQNFILLHEFYHLLTDTGRMTQQPLHLVEPDLDESLEERKADYFASLLLLDSDDMRHFVSSIQDKDVEHIVFYSMERFRAPYKAVLIRLYDLGFLSAESLVALFDRKPDFQREFDRIGLDKACVERSNIVKFDKLEENMQKRELPVAAHQLNVEVFQAVKQYFLQQKG